DLLVEVLGEYLQAMSDAIRSTGGTVDKYIGDAIMAFWNAPDPQDDHVDRACVAALACQGALESLRSTWVARGLPALHARIGLHTGRGLIGNLGSS
ncbi:MAG: adenylate/guanylate cyclase domain-containing protein, partial [Anaerolineales bacterium]|nr:adenylate/guanylate cyclase domain-containing protein [Anaerolineales bacterium]